jgi:hypothetical protein
MAGLIMAGTTNFYGISYPTSTDYVKDGATAIQTVATGFDSAVAIPTYNAQTGATYTFVLSDTGKTVTASNASASTYTIPPTASVAWTANTTLEVTNLGAGVVTFAAGAGVTVTNTAATLAQYGSAAIIRTGLNAWTVTPRSGGSSGLTLISASSFSAQSSVSISNVFTATYDDYQIIISQYGSVNGATLQLRARNNVTDYSGNQYYSGNFRALYTNANSNNGSNGVSSWIINNIGNDSTGRSVSDMIFRPQGTSLYFSSISNDDYQPSVIIAAGRTTTAAAVTGFTIFPSSGTLTGEIKVYGYQRS